MRKFDTDVQYLKYKVLKATSKHAFNDTLLEGYNDIPKEIVPGPKPTTRCCIYKERAIVTERVKLAVGGDKANPNVIEVIDIACDECPVAGYKVTDSCRGCIAHRCESVCKKQAIYFDRFQKAHIDKEKCVECGACAKVCPYSAISNSKRPCENSCKVGAISMDQNRVAQIDNEKCISCGSCVYQCPFGAIMDKSYILDVIKMLKNSSSNSSNVYAIVAPSIVSQFSYARIGQVVSGIKKLGFFSVVEAALGADMVAYSEARELSEKGFLTSSCCPAFVDYIKKYFPKLKEKISSNLSPMATIGKYIKENDSKAKTVFIGPCTAKKMEIKDENVKPYIDSVLTFEELQALFGGLDIDITSLEDSPLDNASYYGRIFARSGGLAESVSKALEEQNLDFNYKPISCDGIENIKMTLLKANRGILPNNFIEGMICNGGCIGGPCALTHEIKDKTVVDKYGIEAHEKSIKATIEPLDFKNL